jgi:signal transduction histidine kinase
MDLSPAIDSLVELGLGVPGARRVAVVRAEGSALVVAAVATASGQPSATGLPLRSVELPAELIEDVFTSGRPQVLTEGSSAFALPIRVEARVAGVLYVERALTAGAFPESWGALLESPCALMVQKAIACAHGETALRLVGEAGVALGEGLDYPDMLARVARRFVPFLADACLMDVLVGAGFRRVAEAHADPAKEGLLRSLRKHRYQEERPHSIAAAVADGQARLFPALPDAVLEGLSLDRFEIAIIRELGLQSAMVVPLTARHRLVGALVFGAEAPARFGQHEVTLAGELARHAALAIDNARLFSQAQQAIELRDEFLTVASHELNTPVASLQLTVQALASARSITPEVFSGRVNLIERQTSRLASLIHQMLTVVILEAGRAPVRTQPVDLAALVGEAVRHEGEALSRAGCEVSVAAEPVVGRWDRGYLEMAVANLLSNALKFGAGKPIEILVERQADTARLVVRDHGGGIPEDVQARVFERFGKATSVTQLRGLGLGLYLVRAVVEALGGRVQVASAVGAGSTFTVELPLAGPPENESPVI